MNSWLAPPAELPPLNQSVHVWAVRLDDASIDLDEARALISADERERAAKFHFDVHRRRYLIAHLALHRILAGYLRTEPARIDFDLGANGKPYLTAEFAGSQLQFNLSHSHETALIALGAGGELGVDVEHARDFDFLPLAERFFTAREVTALRALPRSLQRQGFFKCWTAKEAFLKAKGTGLAGKLDEVEIDLAPGGCVQVHANVAGWSLAELGSINDCEAALVAEGAMAPIRLFLWEAR